MGGITIKHGVVYCCFTHITFRGRAAICPFCFFRWVPENTCDIVFKGHIVATPKQATTQNQTKYHASPMGY